MNAPNIELLVDELRRLVGWGANPHRLPSLPTLRQLSGVDDLPYLTTGYIMRRHLEASIGRLQGIYPFAGHDVPAEKLRRAYRLLFRYEGMGQSVVNRRWRVMMVLGVSYSVERWRRADGPERELLTILAETMVTPHHMST